MMETRYVRMVSSLCAQTYYMHKLTVSPHTLISAMHQTVRAHHLLDSTLKTSPGLIISMVFVAHISVAPASLAPRDNFRGFQAHRRSEVSSANAG